eukprot:CAMPEP_0185726520 /NCGR_PEP_ID=MMETSP1171-20130828/2484_1 /TAXON_ID=374046 /ORGANISM="Helicotheca tamensis, Strain CCMP826" /LENGTH=398 /DNA_ID=CAMNT_0028394897 /DNA_START=33 /DNA_END=1230 /DNA_ORIENTATION=+
MTGEEATPKNAAACVEYVTTEIKCLLEKSNILDEAKEKALPHFYTEEIEKGKRLGSGMFGTVYEITKVNNPKKKKKETTEEDENIEAKDFIAEHCLRENTGDARYAVKILNKDVVEDPELFLKGSLDLAMEANFLSNLMHPNLIKVRGASVTAELGTKDYFVVMDRLYDTLENRMEDWKKKARKLSGPTAMMKKEAKKEFLIERLHVAFELSAALSYIHNLKVIYRDLKPENLGFDIRGDVKIFDFGFAKELHNDMENGFDGSGSELYNLTGKTGTLIYMAPEVVLMKPYNTKSDVYSYGMLLWEFLHLKEPFKKGVTAGMHELMVCKKGIRPKVEKKGSDVAQSLVTQAWAQDIGKRPTMKTINLKLRTEVQKLKSGGDEGNMDFTRRRSTHVFKKK